MPFPSDRPLPSVAPGHGPGQSLMTAGAAFWLALWAARTGSALGLVAFEQGTHQRIIDLAGRLLTHGGLEGLDGGDGLVAQLAIRRAGMKPLLLRIAWMLRIAFLTSIDAVVPGLPTHASGTVVALAPDRAAWPSKIDLGLAARAARRQDIGNLVALLGGILVAGLGGNGKPLVALARSCVTPLPRA